MKSYVEFTEEGGAGGAGSGAAPATGTGGVAGAGDNPQKIVPVFRKKKTTPVMAMVVRKPANV